MFYCIPFINGFYGLYCQILSIVPKWCDFPSDLLMMGINSTKSIEQYCGRSPEGTIPKLFGTPNRQSQNSVDRCSSIVPKVFPMGQVPVGFPHRTWKFPAWLGVRSSVCCTAKIATTTRRWNATDRRGALPARTKVRCWWELVGKGNGKAPASSKSQGKCEMEGKRKASPK